MQDLRKCGNNEAMTSGVNGFPIKGQQMATGSNAATSHQQGEEQRNLNMGFPNYGVEIPSELTAYAVMENYDYHNIGDQQMADGANPTEINQWGNQADNLNVKISNMETWMPADVLMPTVLDNYYLTSLLLFGLG